MSPINAVSNAYQIYPSATDTIRTAERVARKDMPPPSVQDAGRFDRLGRVLDMSGNEVKDAANSPTDLVNMLQSKGVDMGQLRNVLNSGDLINVTA